MNRQSVDEKWLLSYLNNEIHKLKECESCQFDGIMRLCGTDELGCNWSHAYFRSSGQPSEVCSPIAEHVVAEAKKKFNLKAEICDKNQEARTDPTVTTSMQRRMLHIPILHIDANLINARGKLETMNQIERWAEDEVILVNMSGISFREAQAGGNAVRTKKALTHIFTMTDESISPSDPMYQRIEAALFPGGATSENQRNDVKVVYEAKHYGAILVTRDGGSRTQPGGILGNRQKLKEFVQILSDIEAVEFIRSKIDERDEFNRRVAREYGGILPDWTGKD
jgi:hypothetical protein